MRSTSRRPNRTRKAAPSGRRPELVEATVERIGGQGDGIAESASGRLYVPLTVAGDRVRVRLGVRRGDGRLAEVVSLMEAGPGRGEAPCPHFGHCGGCALQHLADETYAAWKRGRLEDALVRAGATSCEVAPLVRTPPGGRRRAVLSALRSGRVLIGFRERRGHAIVDVETCPILDPGIVALLPRLRRLLAGVMPPDSRASVVMARLDAGLDVVFELPHAPDLTARETLAAFAAEADLARLSWRRSANEAAEPIVERRPAAAQFGAVPVRVPPGAFLQASPVGEAALAAEVRGAVGAARSVADLFAGAGTLSFAVARRGMRVHAVDGDPQLLAALSRAAAAEQFSGVTTERRDLTVRPLSAQDLRRFDAAILDPPRSGARAQAEAIAASAVPVVAYVSCNPDTFARDARILIGGGYRLVRAAPVDQFLWSPHLELAATFGR